MSITQNYNFNSFNINKITIDDFNVDNQFNTLMFEEGLFTPFIYGTLVLNKLTFVYPDNWKNKELGWINRELSIEWETKLINNSKAAGDKKDLKFIIYSIAEETETFIVLLFIQKSAINFYNLNFCDGWDNVEISKIIKDIINKNGSNNLEINVDETSTKISFTNPLTWTPIKTILYLLPMMKGVDSKDYGYFFYSSSDKKINCKSINHFLKKIKEDNDIENLTHEDNSEKSEEDYGSSDIIGRMLSFKLNNNNNILEEINNNLYGNIVNEYNIKTKEITKTKIKDILKNITNFGDYSNLHDDYKDYERIKFYFNNINGKEIEINESIREFFSKNTMIVTAYGLNTRNIGSGVKLVLKSNDNYLEFENSEYANKCIITKIKHMFNKDEYIQELTLCKPGLNKYTKPTPLLY